MSRAVTTVTMGTGSKSQSEQGRLRVDAANKGITNDRLFLLIPHKTTTQRNRKEKEHSSVLYVTPTEFVSVGSIHSEN